MGSRVTAELLAGIAVDHDLQHEIERRLDRIIGNADAIRILGFDRWPPLPLRLVPPR